MIKFRVLGSNQRLQMFLQLCDERNIPVSSENSFFREDYGHCVMPCYAYDPMQPNNIKLQTLANLHEPPMLQFHVDDDTQMQLAVQLCTEIARIWAIQQEAKKNPVHCVIGIKYTMLGAGSAGEEIIGVFTDPEVAENEAGKWKQKNESLKNLGYHRIYTKTIECVMDADTTTPSV